jgi:ribosome-binding factor A
MARHGGAPVTQRTQRIDELFRQEIGAILARDIGDPRIGFATVTQVETDPDLRHARVWVSVIGEPAQRDATIAALGRAMVFVRRELGTRLRLRRIPEFHVRLDDTAERGTRVLQLLHEIEQGHLPNEAPAPGESLPTPVARLPRDGDVVDHPAAWAEADGRSGPAPRKGKSGHGAKGPGAHPQRAGPGARGPRKGPRR